MGIPKCKFCGSNHWPRDPHIFADDVPVSKLARAEPIAVVARPVVTPARPVEAVVVSPPSLEKRVLRDPKAHRDHMRGYMRVKRARERIPRLEAELARLRALVEGRKL